MALSRDDFMALWKSVVDPEYSRPFLENPDSGIEVYGLAAETFARLCEAIEVNLQSFYVKPWSGQTAPPASGPARATVTLTVSRESAFRIPIVLEASRITYEEELWDAGEDGGTLHGTQRRYVSLATQVMLPGETSITFTAESEREGAGYNIPDIGSITRINEVATGLTGDGASVVPGVASHVLVFGVGDQIPPAAVGQYLQFFAGANEGTVWRVINYLSPNGTTYPNGAVTLAATGLLEVTAVTGAFQPGELVEQAGTGAAGLFRAVGNGWFVYENVNPIPFGTGAIAGIVSGATANVTAVTTSPFPTAEVGVAAWQLFGWGAFGIGLAVTNPVRPTGGATAMLDHAGYERGIGRSPGESDDLYRERIVQLPDTVSPNAIKRAMNRVLAPYGIEGCLREPGELETFQGLFYDTPNLSGPYAYAYDLPETPEHRFKVALDLSEFRGFMFITLPRIGLGDFGCGYDEGGLPFYDASPFEVFHDGYPVTQGEIYRNVWNAVEKARAGGVGFVILPDQYGC